VNGVSKYYLDYAAHCLSPENVTLGVFFEVSVDCICIKIASLPDEVDIQALLLVIFSLSKTKCSALARRLSVLNYCGRLLIATIVQQSEESGN